MLLRFTQIFIRLKVLFIRGNYRVTLSHCIIHSVKIRGICGRNFTYIELTSNKSFCNSLVLILSLTLINK
nr:MAG TPA: hypothetical protein [Caudoviricetes sp.]